MARRCTSFLARCEAGARRATSGISLAISVCILAMSAAAHPGEAASARLGRAHAQLLEAGAQGRPQTCHQIRTEFERDPPEDWSTMAFLVWVGLAGCEWLPGGAWTRRTPDAEEIRRAWELTFRHFDRMPIDQRLKADTTVNVRVEYWFTLRSFDSPVLAAEAEAEEAATLDDWHRRAAQSPPDALAVASLTRLGAAVYGKRRLADWMQRQQQRLESTLGPGHAATLHMLRARIFAARAHEQPLEALALSDDYAARAARHQPNDQRLSMLNRSERIGALAGVGRHGDAIDEGRLLLDWLKGQEPTPLGNLMRVSYNLAGVALEMGDADAAEAFARMSLSYGERSHNHDRHETVVSRRLALQAQLQRGDDRAGPALKTLLQGIQSWDLPGLDAVLAVLQWARRHGDVDTEQWAIALIGQVSRAHSAPLQSVRALPLMLNADAAAAGSDEGLRAAAAALAHGLAGDGRPLEVRASFALAQHVAPRQPVGAAWLCKRAARALVDWRQSWIDSTAGQPRLWLVEHEHALRHCIGVLIDLGRLGEAEQMLAVLRDEELHEFRRRSRGQVVRAAMPRQLGLTTDERRRDASVAPLQALLRQEAAAARGRANALTEVYRPHTVVDPQADQVIERAANELQAVSLQAPERTRSPASSREPEPRQPIRGRARITFVLSYGGEGANSASSAVWAMVDAGAQPRRVVLPVDSATLSRAVAALRAQISQPSLPGDSTVPEAARRLHAWLIQPLSRQLRGVQHLTIVPDGVLRYVPFAALHDGHRYLAEQFSVSMQLTSAGTTSAASPQADSRPLAVAAFGRSQASATHSALPGVVDELASVSRLAGATVRVALDGQFSRASLVDALQQRPQLVHLASHFVLAPASEEESYLLLGDGTKLSLRELRQLPWQGVKLALLSSCDSALPIQLQGATEGREWAGFAAALQQAGVREVMATLWRIDDADTARWMSEFYQQWAAAGLAGPVNATLLSRSQRAWLRRYRQTEQAHPRHWAGFVWISTP